jgi:hypothetical protein
VIKNGKHSIVRQTVPPATQVVSADSTVRS